MATAETKTENKWQTPVLAAFVVLLKAEQDWATVRENENLQELNSNKDKATDAFRASLIDIPDDFEKAANVLSNLQKLQKPFESFINPFWSTANSFLERGKLQALAGILAICPHMYADVLESTAKRNDEKAVRAILETKGVLWDIESLHRAWDVATNSDIKALIRSHVAKCHGVMSYWVSLYITCGQAGPEHLSKALREQSSRVDFYKKAGDTRFERWAKWARAD